MYRITAALLAATLSSAAHAADSEDRITVTATRTPLSVAEAIAPVIVIDADELRRSATFDLAEVLRLHAGIEIGRSGGPGQPVSLFLRGTNSNHTLVLIDGVRINPGTLGGAAIHHVRPIDIERIEVVKGPRSALYGTEAIGGVVNIITRRPQSALQLSSRIGVGAYGTRELGASLSGSGTRGYAGATVDQLSSEGFPTRTGSTVDRGHDNLTVHAFAGFDNGPVNVDVHHWQATGNTEYLDFFLNPVDQDFRNDATALTATFDSGALVATARLSQTTDRIVQSQSPDFARTRRHALEVQIDRASGAHVLSGGLALAEERTAAEVFGSAFSENPETEAVFLAHQWAGDGRRTMLAIRRGQHDAYGSNLNWHAEFGQELAGTWRMTLGAGTAFRAPDSTQRFGFGGNPALEPERARSIEVGMHGRISNHTLLTWQIYDMRITDLVNYDVGAGQLDNIDAARIRGTELVLLVEAAHWTLRQGLTFAIPEDRSTGGPLPRRARRSAQTSLVFQASETLSLQASMLASGKRLDSAFSPAETGGYALFNLGAELRLGEAWSADLRLENVFDRAYETALGYPQAGRSAYLRVRWNQRVAD